MTIFPVLDTHCLIAFQKGGSNFHSNSAYGHGCLFHCALTSVQRNLKIFVAHLMGRKKNHYVVLVLCPWALSKGTKGNSSLQSFVNDPIIQLIGTYSKEITRKVDQKKKKKKHSKLCVLCDSEM